MGNYNVKQESHLELWGNGFVNGIIPLPNIFPPNH
jgi:hypothetical protein